MDTDKPVDSKDESLISTDPTSGESLTPSPSDESLPLEATIEAAPTAPPPTPPASRQPAIPSMASTPALPPQPTQQPPQYASEYVQPTPQAQPQPTYTQYPEYSTPAPQLPQAPYQQSAPTLHPQPQQYAQYYSQRRGLPTWAWVTGGLFLLVLLAGGILTLVLVLGGGGSGTSTPTEATRSFYQKWGARDFTGAFALIAPESQASTSPDNLKTVMDQYEAQLGKFQSVTVSNNAEQGDTATNTATIKFANGQEVQAQVTLRKINNKWLIISN